MICYQAYKSIWSICWFLVFFGIVKCPKNGDLCPILTRKIEKMADFCGFAGVCAANGAVFRGFFVVGRVIFVPTGDFVMALG